MYRGREMATRVSLYAVVVKAFTVMLACIAMSTLVITSVSAQTRDTHGRIFRRFRSPCGAMSWGQCEVKFL
jgi:hypothetical protein